MTHRDTNNISGNAKDDSHPVDELVQAYLNTEASTVDGAALLARARRTHRNKRLMRQAGIVAATAASIAILVIAYVASLPKHSTPEPLPPIAINTPNQNGDPLVNAVSAIDIDSLLPDAATATEDIGQAFAQSRITLASDVKCLRQELGGLVSTSLNRAGLVL